MALALGIPLVRKVLDIVRQCMTKRRFPKEEEPRQALLLDGTHPPFREGVQVGRLGWQDHTLDTSLIDDLLARGAALGVAVMDERLTG